MSFERHDALATGTILHGHTVEKVMSEGGFGIVYLVSHLATGEKRVIKEYMPSFALRAGDSQNVGPRSISDQDTFEWGLKAFVEEAQLLMRMKHLYVVPVIEAFHKFGTAYLVMPYVNGMTLTDWLKQNGRPGQSDMDKIFIALLEALKYVHENDILHRDIKPDNILIKPDGQPVLIDFGSARQSAASKSQMLTQVLTHHFAAFEQYSSNGPFTPALDYYGLAATMYFSLTGRLPPQAPDRIHGDPYESLIGDTTLSSEYRPSMLATIDRCLCVFARDRLQSAFEIQRAMLGELPENVITVPPLTPEPIPESSPGSEANPEPGRQQEINKLSTNSYAGFWKRFMAAIIDAIVTTGISFAVGMGYGILVVLAGNEPYIDDGTASVLNLLINWTYFARMESSSSQATLGKMALGIKVTDLDGYRISFGRATGRYFGKIISMLVFCIGFLMVAFTKKKQGLHDMMAGCLVVNK